MKLLSKRVRVEGVGGHSVVLSFFLDFFFDPKRLSVACMLPVQKCVVEEVDRCISCNPGLNPGC